MISRRRLLQAGGLAAGAAMTGKIVFTYSIANFPTLRCLEQIRNDLCYHNANVKIVVAFMAPSTVANVADFGLPLLGPPDAAPKSIVDPSEKTRKTLPVVGSCATAHIPPGGKGVKSGGDRGIN
jgi:hypothetical protein